MTSIIKQLFTLVFVRDGNKILLGYKKRGFGIGKWNGFGGKVKINETIVHAAVRELKEECSLVVQESDLNQIGHIIYFFENNSKAMDVRIFVADKFHGDIAESDEMEPRWFKTSEFPYHKMWIDDPYWYPLMFANKYFKSQFWFRGHDQILNHTIVEIQSSDEFDQDCPPYKGYLF